MPSILDDIIKNNALTEAAIAYVESNLVVKNVVKGKILQRKGDRLSKGYFVKKGCLRSYTIDEKGKEHIFMFAPEGWIIGDILAMASPESGCVFFIDAIEDSEIEVFDTAFFEKINAKSALGVEKLLKRITVLQKRIIMLMSATAWERYQDFIETYPNIVQRVPQKMIASYLGITPEALSKIRGEKKG